jgi:hypothetical protein
VSGNNTEQGAAEEYQPKKEEADGWNFCGNDNEQGI